LKPLAKAALSIEGRALGTFVGGPVGGKLASAAGRMFGLELEGLSAEDREFEVARRFVRFASATTKNALERVEPQSAANWVKSLLRPQPVLGQNSFTFSFDDLRNGM
jgi:hypothetical protein